MRGHPNDAPVFPLHLEGVEHQGITRLEVFAAAALQGIVARWQIGGFALPPDMPAPDRLAAQAWEMAKAMLDAHPSP